MAQTQENWIGPLDSLACFFSFFKYHINSSHPVYQLLLTGEKLTGEGSKAHRF